MREELRVRSGVLEQLQAVLPSWDVGALVGVIAGQVLGSLVRGLCSLEFPLQTFESHWWKELVRMTFQKAHSGECLWESDCRQAIKRPLEQPFGRDTLTMAVAEEVERRGHHKEKFREDRYRGGDLGLRAYAANPAALFPSWL